MHDAGTHNALTKAMVAELLALGDKPAGDLCQTYINVYKLYTQTHQVL
jgi:hypothetical protein